MVSRNCGSTRLPANWRPSQSAPMWRLPHGASQAWDVAFTSGNAAVRARRQVEIGLRGGSAVAVGFQARRDPDEMAVVEAGVDRAETLAAADQQTGDDEQETTPATWTPRKMVRARPARGTRLVRRSAGGSPKTSAASSATNEGGGEHAPIGSDAGVGIVLQLNHLQGDGAEEQRAQAAERASRSDSVNNWRTTRGRLAPSAMRVRISRSRVTPRARTSVPRLAQAATSSSMHQGRGGQRDLELVAVGVELVNGPRFEILARPDVVGARVRAGGRRARGSPAATPGERRRAGGGRRDRARSSNR